MFDLDKWQEIYSTIKRHKLRTFLTAFGVAWGVFILVLLLGSGNGLKNGINISLQSNAENSVWVYPGVTSTPYQGLKTGRFIKFDNSDFEMIQKIKGVEHTSGVHYLSPENSLIQYAGKQMQYSILAVHPQQQFLNKIDMLHGRFINKFDLDNYRKVVCIGLDVAIDLFGEEDIQKAEGTYLLVGNEKYQIVGVYYDKEEERSTDQVYAPISTVQKVFGSKELDQIMFTTGTLDLKSVKKIETEVRAKLANRFKFSVEDKQAIYMKNDLARFEQFQTLFQMIRYFVWFVGIGCIGAGVIGISNIMLISVKDRTKEIGIRRALGSSNFSIIQLILTEAGFLTLLSGYLGLLSAVSILFAVQAMFEQFNIQTPFFRNPEVELSTVLSAIFLLVFTGLLAGLIPAVKAIKVPPVEAIRL